MADHASDYVHGEMDIHQQEASYRGFYLLAKWGSLAVAVAVLFATISFCTDAGIVTGLIAGIVLAAIGIFALRSRGHAGH
ncbi:MAG: aa3-type cytochrome c oxidase subunit IV [Caulobacteraceae bacterium]